MQELNETQSDQSNNRRKTASKGGKARAAALTPAERSRISSEAALARWATPEQEEQEAREVIEGSSEDTLENLPEAKYRGFLNLLGVELPCYVLETGQRVIGRISMTEMLTGIKGGGDLEKYLSVQALRPFIDIKDVKERMVSFSQPEVQRLVASNHTTVKGLPPDLVIDICRGFTSALEAHNQPDNHTQLSARQLSMAIQATQFLAAIAKVGLDALVDEATGYQYERAQDALEVKLKAYLETEMRKWEKTFPDELWIEFARLTNWQGSVTQRPKYWGKLVMELVYQRLDKDVAEWLKNNAPKPRGGQNYHQWLSSQYGLKKLVEHIWMLIGIAKTCSTMTELRDKMAEMSGEVPIQMRMYLPPPNDSKE
jgi:hypothetical protein